MASRSTFLGFVELSEEFLYRKEDNMRKVTIAVVAASAFLFAGMMPWSAEAWK